MPPPAAPSHVMAASSSWTLAMSPWSLCACFISALRSGIFPLDIGFYLLDLSAERLQHVLRDRMLARLELALGSLLRAPLARRLEHRARRDALRFGGIEQPHRQLDVRERRPELADDAAELVDDRPLHRHLAHAVDLDGKSQLDLVGGPREDARVLEWTEEREPAACIEGTQHVVPCLERLVGRTGDPDLVRTRSARDRRRLGHRTRRLHRHWP